MHDHQRRQSTSSAQYIKYGTEERFAFQCPMMSSDQGETYRRHSRCNEAGASFNTDPSSDDRQMHLNVVKRSN
ncbi:hypothetical protein TNCV_4449211 [Trichonephila clavipes]|nr:hypothetical protein TNCV_4449211 [Trichonephila clavipes]